MKEVERFLLHLQQEKHVVLMQDSLQLDELRTLHRLFKVILQPEHRLIRAFSHAFPELRKSPLFTSSIIGSITKSDQAPTNVSAGAWKYVVNQIAAASLILSFFKNKVKTSYFTLASQAIILKQFN